VSLRLGEVIEFQSEFQRRNETRMVTYSVLANIIVVKEFDANTINLFLVLMREIGCTNMCNSSMRDIATQRLKG